MCGLEDGRDVGSADRAAAVISIEDDRLERALTEPVGREARVAEYRSGSVPGLAEVKLHFGAQEEVEKFLEVRSYGLVRKVIALALDDVAGKVRRRRCGCVLGEEAHVPHRQPMSGSPLTPMGCLR